MGWAIGDFEVLERIANALERSAAADEKRNALLIADAAERRESWARHEQQSAEAIDRITGDGFRPDSKENT